MTTNTSRFILQLPLQLSKAQAVILNKRFKIGRQMYNAVMHIAINRCKEMTKTKKYRYLQKSLTDDTTKNKAILQEINDLCKQYAISKNDFEKTIKCMQHHFRKNIDAFTAQTIAAQVWKSIEVYLFGKGKKNHFKRYENFTSLEGKSNNTGIRFKNNCLQWNGLVIPIHIDYNNPYEAMAIQLPVAYCRIVRKFIKNKYKYYVQLVLKGAPPPKIDKNTGEFLHTLGVGDVGIDIGTSTIAISSNTAVRNIELADKVQSIDRKRLLLLRKMDRSKRATNPNNYNVDGTCKKGVKKWNYSKHYIQMQHKVKDLYRKQADVRKQQHEQLANYIMSLGNKFYVEDMMFSALTKRTKKTTYNAKGRPKSKKRFGKSVANRAPAKLLEILNNKLQYNDLQLIKIDTFKAKASQYNHITQEYLKKPLSQRWTQLTDEIKVQRDMYSAFLIMNVNDNLESFDLNKCNNRFENFLKLHNNEITRLSHTKTLSCMGI